MTIDNDNNDNNDNKFKLCDLPWTDVCPNCLSPVENLYMDGTKGPFCLVCVLNYLKERVEKIASPYEAGSTKIMHPPTDRVAVYLKPETVDFVKRMAQQMATQNNRMTATPYFFTIKETAVVTAADGRGDSYEFLNRDSTETYTVEEMRGYIDDHVDETDEEVDSSDSDTLTKETLLDLLDRGCLDELAEALDMELIELQTIESNTNGFFTERAAEAHLEQRGHRYREGSSVWLEEATYNPEMDVVWDLIMQVGGIKGWRK